MVRIKQRYLLVQALPSGYGNRYEITKAEFSRVILQHIQKYYGLFGYGCCSKLSVVYCNWIKTGVIILRCRFERVEMLKTVLAVLGTSKHPYPFRFNLIHVSGTVRSCKRNAIKYDKECFKHE